MQSSSSRHSSQSPSMQYGSSPPQCVDSRHSTQRPSATAQRRVSPAAHSSSLRQLGHTGNASLQPGSGSQPAHAPAMQSPVSQLGASQLPASASQSVMGMAMGSHVLPSHAALGAGACGVHTPASQHSAPVHGAGAHMPPSQLAPGQLSLVHTGVHTPPGHACGQVGPAIPAAQRSAALSASLQSAASQRSSVHSCCSSQLLSRHSPVGGQLSPTHS